MWEWLEKIRRLIDGEPVSDPSKKTDPEISMQLRAQGLAAGIAEKIESIMRREMLIMKDGTRRIPRWYVVFLSNRLDKEWPGEKRDFLTELATDAVLDKARMLTNENPVRESFTVQLRVNPTYEGNEYAVWHGWDLRSHSATSSHTPPESNASAEVDEQADVSNVRAFAIKGGNS